MKWVRVVLAAAMLLGITALLLDSSNLLMHRLGWMPRLQLLPAIMALNVATVISVLVMTFLIGRLYCSIVCPMGIFQDLFIWLHSLIFPKKTFRYRRPKNWLRYAVLVLFIALTLFGLGSVAALIAPYSAFARMIIHLHGSGLPQVVAIATLVLVGVLSFGWGRTWCNTICPVGATLSLASRYSLFGIVVDKQKCVGCRACEKSCKAMCIDIDHKEVDTSRCIDCFNCLSKCRFGALTLRYRYGHKASAATTTSESIDSSRRQFIAVGAAVGTAMAVQAQEQKLDGGFAVIAKKQVPQRRVPLKPFGAISVKNFESRCTGCQLCVSKCPEHVLRPSTQLNSFLQPEMSYADGYCRTACTRCSQVCPAGAIQPITPEEKTSISIGRAIVIAQNCISATGEDHCGSCARHCPAAAISMVENEEGHLRPTVNESRCIGCGACEYYCPARPQVAIYVEGREVHNTL